MMRSRLGAAASATVLLAILAGIAAGAAGSQTLAEGVIHFGVGAGFVLLAIALADFGVARWLTWIGSISAGAFGAIFLLQGVADLVRSARLHDIAFGLLGHDLERTLPVVLLAWFAALLLTGTRGRSSWLGWLILPLAIGLEVAAGIGMLIGIEVPFLKLHLFLPLVWLLVESIKSPAAQGPDPRSRAAATTATA
jgi:hypothetical protein